MIIRLLGTITALLIVASATTYLVYRSAINARIEDLNDASEVAQTSEGPLEYTLREGGDETLLFIHGTPGGHDQSPEPDAFTVVAPSRPGYLRSPITTGRTPQEQAHAYAALLDELGIEQVFVMGASGGGPSSMAFAAQYPERTKGLIALEALSYAEPIGEEAIPAFMTSDFGFWVVINGMLLVFGHEGIISQFVPDPVNQQLLLTDKKKIEAVENVLFSGWPVTQRADGLANDFKQFAEMQLPLSDIKVPVLIIHGTADVNVEISHAEHLKEQVPHAILHTIPGADHMMPFSHQEEMNEVIERFVEDVLTAEISPPAA